MHVTWWWHEGCSGKLYRMNLRPKDADPLELDRYRISEVARDSPELLARLIHDLRNPLSVILSFAEFVATASDSERDELCGRLRVNAHRALQILEEFSLLSDLRQERAQPQCGECDLSALIQETAKDLEAQGDVRGQRIAYETGEPQLLQADRMQLERALRCLLREVLRGLTEELSVRVNTVSDEDGARIRVTISGQLNGQKPDRTLIDMTTPQMELVRRVVSLHGGTVSFEGISDLMLITVHIPPQIQVSESRLLLNY